MQISISIQWIYQFYKLYRDMGKNYVSCNMMESKKKNIQT